MFNREVIENFLNEIKGLELPSLSEEDKNELLTIVGVLSTAQFNMRLAHKVMLLIKNSQLDEKDQLPFEGDPDINYLIDQFKILDNKYRVAWRDKIDKYSELLATIRISVPKVLIRFKSLDCIKEDSPKIILLH